MLEASSSIPAMHMAMNDLSLKRNEMTLRTLARSPPPLVMKILEQTIIGNSPITTPPADLRSESCEETAGSFVITEESEPYGMFVPVKTSQSDV